MKARKSARHFQLCAFATITTDASCGAVNSMHDSFMPLGGSFPVQYSTRRDYLRRRRPGLYGMLVFFVLAVFIAG